MERPASLDKGRIVLGAPLGEGAQGEVLAATRDGVELAVKLVHDDRVSPRFHGEVRALAAVDHPNVVRIVDYGMEAPWSWMAMERIRGGSLEALVADGVLDVPEALRVVFDLLCGLASLHHRLIVHRDVKPSNVFMGHDGRVVLGDLGIARLPRGEVDYRTATGATLGTVDYAAPEQYGQARKAVPAADLYGVGATLYAITVGSRPSYLYAREDLPFVYDKLPVELHDFVARACQHEPSDRYLDARTMAEAAVRLRDELTGGSDHDAWMARFDALSPAPSFCVAALRRFWSWWP